MKGQKIAENYIERDTLLLEMEKRLYNEKEQHMLQLYRAFIME